MAVNKQDKDFGASDACTGCGTCRKVCSVGNIRINSNKLSFSTFSWTEKE